MGVDFLGKNNPRTSRNQTDAYDGLQPGVVRLAQAPASSPFVTDLAAAIEGPQQFIVLNDFGHEIAPHEFVARKSTLDTLQKANIKNIFVEFPPSFQPLVDQLAKGEISRDKFIDVMREKYVLTYQSGDDARRMHGATADMIINAKQRGINVVLVDSDRTVLNAQNPELVKFEDELIKVVKRQQQIDKIDFSSISAENLSDYNHMVAENYAKTLPVDRQVHLRELFESERLKQDQSIAKNMQKIAGSDRAVILYGGAHEAGFESVIGRDNMNKILLYTNASPESLQKDVPSQEGWKYYKIEQQATPAPTPSVGRPRDTLKPF